MNTRSSSRVLLQDAVKAAAERAQLGNDYQQEYMEVDLSWQQLLAQQVSAVSGRLTRALAPDLLGLSVFRERLEPMQRELQRLQRFAQKGGAYYYCACVIE